MFPETDFYRKKNLMFLIVSATYYNTGNSKAVDTNYLTLCELRFPLTKGRSLIDEETSYLKRNNQRFQDFRQEVERQINEEGRHLEAIKQNLEIQEDVYFFLSQICQPHNPNSFEANVKASVGENQFDLEYNKKPIFPQLLQKDCAIINQRVYPLDQTQEPIFVSLDGKNYTISSSTGRVEDVETNFQKILEERIRMQALRDSKRVDDLKGKISNLQEKIVSLGLALNAKKYTHCYECGDIGYDFTSKLVYWLIPGHDNHTTGKNYGEGQSAATLPLKNQTIETTPKFAERKNRDYQFETSSKDHCLGFKLVGNSPEEKMQFLHTFVNVVINNGAFYQISNSNDDSGGYY